MLVLFEDCVNRWVLRIELGDNCIQKFNLGRYIRSKI